ncbi:MAG: hypothetical protein JW839_16310 [Candidatus Lokiarchaeota archaeon]|nr:hypothetical protein [Candidatus Lokiarchaeota archaeon]
MAVEAEQSLVLKCPTCGASIAISPEDLVITCSFCGETMEAGGKKIPDHKMLPSQERSAIQANIQDFLRKNKIKEGASIEEVKASYIPWWLVPFSSQTHYYGVQNGTVTRQKTETYRDSEGKTRTRTVSYSVPVYKPEEGDFARSGRENVIARKHTVFYGFDKFASTIFLENIEAFDFQKVKQHDAEFINAEVDAHEAQQDAYGRVENQNRSIAASKVSKLVRCDSKVTLQYPTYVHAPLWTARYKFQGKVYKVSAAGDSGKVVKGEVPLTLGRRLLNLIIGLSIMVVGGIIAQIGFQSGQVVDQEGWYIAMIIGLVFMGISFMCTSTAFRMQLEKSDRIKKPPKKKAQAAPAEATAPQPEA